MVEGPIAETILLRIKMLNEVGGIIQMDEKVLQISASPPCTRLAETAVLLLAWKPRLGRLQRQARRAFIVFDGAARML
jgi:hypothetical protein